MASWTISSNDSFVSGMVDVDDNDNRNEEPQKEGD